MVLNPFSPSDGPWWTFTTALGRYLLVLTVIAIIFVPVVAWMWKSVVIG